MPPSENKKLIRGEVLYLSGKSTVGHPLIRTRVGLLAFSGFSSSQGPSEGQSIRQGNRYDLLHTAICRKAIRFSYMDKPGRTSHSL